MSITRSCRGRFAGAALGVAALLLSAACGGGGPTRSDPQEGPFPSRLLRIMAPAALGGGWDQTSRSAKQVLQKDGIVLSGVHVFNVPGAGGTAGLAQLVGEESDGYLLMTMGLVMLGAIETAKPEVRLDRVTPIALLTSEYEALAVRADSPYRTLQDFVAAWKKDPRSVPIAGGSSGGADQILAGLMAKAADINGREVNYVPFAGGGAGVSAIVSGKVEAGISGVGEYREAVTSGRLRILAVSSKQRLSGVDAPTFKEAGLNVELPNWRGLVAPPDISESDRYGLERIIISMHNSPRWRAELEKYGWEDTFMPSREFATFLTQEQARVRDVLLELGLT